MINYFGGPNFGWPGSGLASFLANNEEGNHIYTFCLESPHKNVNERFTSRTLAVHRMYELCDKYQLHIKEVWDDHHYKTYICDDGSKFFINRL